MDKADYCFLLLVIFCVNKIEITAGAPQPHALEPTTYANCANSTCRADVALADYKRTLTSSLSTLGAQASAGINDLGVARAEAHAHIANIEGEGLDGWAHYNMNAGKLYVFSEAGSYVLGVGVGATLAEIGGHIGKGPFGVGAKIGLSVDTGVSLSKMTGFIKVLGTGVGFGSKGFEVCLFGSCVYIG